MAHGGHRPGAGRKTGGKNKASAEAVAHAAATGETPLDYMLRVMRDEKSGDARRDDMAKAAAPFCHHRLATTELTGKGGGPIEARITDARAELHRKLARAGSESTG